VLAVLALAEAELAEPSLAAWGRAGLSGARLQSDEEDGGAMAVDSSGSEEEDSSSDEDESLPRPLAMDSSSEEDEEDDALEGGGELALGVMGAPAADAGRGGLDEVGAGATAAVRALSRTCHTPVPLQRRQPCSLWLCIWQRAAARGRRR
jgi:hypothetical protein